MAKGDLHVEQKRGAWQVEEEGHSVTSRQVVEQLANREQAWRVALFYAETANVDVFLHDDRKIRDEKRFRPERARRRR